MERRKAKSSGFVATIVCVCLILSCTSISFGATKSLYGKHSEIFLFNKSVSCTVNIAANIALTYTDTTTTRKVTKHCYDMLFTSPNAVEATSNLTCSMGILCHNNPGQVKCPNDPAYGHTLFTPLPYVAHKHSDGGKTVQHQLRSSVSCQVAYSVSGGSITTKSHTFKFSKIAKKGGEKL